jgi:hypothetical protein
VLAAPGLPNSLYMEELVTATVQLAKYQLQYNVLAFHDAQYKRLYRPTSATGVQFVLVAAALVMQQVMSCCVVSCRNCFHGVAGLLR